MDNKADKISKLVQAAKMKPLSTLVQVIKLEKTHKKKVAVIRNKSLLSKKRRPFKKMNKPTKIAISADERCE